MQSLFAEIFCEHKSHRVIGVDGIAQASRGESFGLIQAGLNAPFLLTIVVTTGAYKSRHRLFQILGNIPES